MLAFDNKKYLQLQSKEILDRVKTFDNPYLGFNTPKFRINDIFDEIYNL